MLWGSEESKEGVIGGAGGDRTLYLFNAIEALSQVSYSPTVDIYVSKGVFVPQVPRPLLQVGDRG